MFLVSISSNEGQSSLFKSILFILALIISLSFNSTALALPGFEDSNFQEAYEDFLANVIIPGEINDLLDDLGFGGDDDGGVDGAAAVRACAEACAQAKAVAKCKAKACIDCTPNIAGDKNFCKVERKTVTKRIRHCVKSCATLTCNGVVVTEQASSVSFAHPSLARMILQNQLPSGEAQITTKAAVIVAQDFAIFKRYAFTNTNLGILNLLEISNPLLKAVAVTVAVEGISHTITVSANGQVDLNLNDLFPQELTPNTISKVGVFANTIALQVRLSQYRPGADGFPDVEAALATDLGPAMTGDAYILSNLHHPANSSNHKIQAWMSILNVAEKSQSYIVHYITNSGEQLNKRITVKAGERRDIEAGHESLGQNIVAMLWIETLDKNASNLFQLARYGYNTLLGKYDFASVQQGRTGLRGKQFAAISRLSAEVNWVEIANPVMNSVGKYMVRMYAGEQGAIRFEGILNITGGKQEHLSVHDYLAVGERGFIEVEALTEGGRALVNSMHYGFDKNGVNLQTVYTNVGRSSTRGPRSASVNAYIGHKNKVRISSVSAQSAAVKISMPHRTTQVVTIPAFATIEFPLNDLFGLQNEYGLITFTADASNASADLLVEILRNKPFEYVVPVSAVAYGETSTDDIGDSSQYLESSLVGELAAERVREIMHQLPAELSQRGLMITDVHPAFASYFPQELITGEEEARGSSMRFGCVFSYVYAYAWATAWCRTSVCVWCLDDPANKVCDADTDVDFDWDVAFDWAWDCGLIRCNIEEKELIDDIDATVINIEDIA